MLYNAFIVLGINYANKNSSVQKCTLENGLNAPWVLPDVTPIKLDIIPKLLNITPKLLDVCPTVMQKH
jgi:hypothetical protein